MNVSRENIKQGESPLLAQVASFVSDPLFVIDRRGKVLVWNDAVEALTGVNSEDIIGKGNHEYSVSLHGRRQPDLIDFVFEEASPLPPYLENARREGGTLYLDLALSPGNRSKKSLFRVIARPLYDETGLIKGAAEVLRESYIQELQEDSFKEGE